ncbi:late competence protein ComER [Bacillaceae bacterium]
MNVGFIGTGSMGSILIEAFIEARALTPAQILASNRSKGKVQALADKFPGLRVAETNREVARQADLLFICVKPLEYKNVLDEIAPLVRGDQIVVSITSPVQVKHLEDKLPAKIAKVIPSITNSVHSGPSLVIFGERMNHADRESILSLFSQISEPIQIDERHTRVSSDLASCGPAFVSCLLQKMIDAAVEETRIPRSDAVFLTTQMIVGLGELFAREKYSLQTLQEKVCVPGGVTGVGLSVLEREIGGLFRHLFQKTHEKAAEDSQLINEMFFQEK